VSFGVRLNAALGLLLAPIAWPQGLLVRHRTPSLPEAPGPRRGHIPGTGQDFHLLGIGESPMAAVGLADQQQALTVQLAGLIHAVSKRPVQWRTLARGGVTARRTRTELLAKLDQGPADLVVIALGVNDSLKINSARAWQSDLEQLLDTLHDRIGPTPVVLTGVPDMGQFPALPPPLSILLGTRARLLDQVAAALAGRRSGTFHVPMPLDAAMESLFCRDGFHPSAAGHRAWAEHLFAQLKDRVDF
jgi:lysophospholipase L1-like esterase